MWILFLAALVVSYACLQRTRAPRALYPPGPKPKPFIGNTFDFPRAKPWVKYMDWSRQFNSGMIHVFMRKSHIVVVNTMEDAIALLEKRSAISSSRPSPEFRQMIGIDRLTPVLPYGDAWRAHRRICQSGLKKGIISSYHALHTEKVHNLLWNLLDDPAGYTTHFKMLGSGVILSTTFGYELTSQRHDHLVDMADFITKAAVQFILPGSSLIHVFPILRHIPPWVPGAVTQKFAALVKKTVDQYINEPFEFVRKGLADGTSKDCMLARLLQDGMSRPDKLYDEEVLRGAMATLYLAGGETIQCAQTIFVFTMALHPREQRKAQEEIDRVVGTDRLPTFQDRDSLPYVEALYREVLRWRPVVPMNSAHCTVKEDFYKGFHMPKGTHIIGNIWAISRDEAVYRDPNSFMPERFFTEDGSLNSDKVGYAFGFGRRICAGRHVADSILWLAIASLLSTFNISKARDESGKEIDLNLDAFTDTFVSHPLPFKCSIKPRSPQAEVLICASHAEGY